MNLQEDKELLRMSVEYNEIYDNGLLLKTKYERNE